MKYFSNQDEAIKNQIVSTVIFNIRYDLNSFDVIPIDGLISDSNVNLDDLLISILRNQNVTAEFIKTKFSPVFFSNENPTNITICWEVLKKANGYEYSIKRMTLEYFKSFVENADELIPIVEMLASYGFQYLHQNLFFHHWDSCLKHF